MYSTTYLIYCPCFHPDIWIQGGLVTIISITVVQGIQQRVKEYNEIRNRKAGPENSMTDSTLPMNNLECGTAELTDME